MDPELPLSVRSLAARLRTAMGARAPDTVSLDTEYFPHVFVMRNPPPRRKRPCKGTAIGAVFCTLRPITEGWDYGDEPLELHMDTQIFDCRALDAIYAYCSDWAVDEKEDATSFIAEYRLRHEYRDNRKITDFFRAVK